MTPPEFASSPTSEDPATPASGPRAPRRRWTPQQRREAIAEFAESGLTQAQFCRRAGLSAATFSAWYRKRTGEDDASTAGFARVQVSATPAATMPTTGTAIAVQLEAGLAVSVPVGTDAVWVAQVVQALRRH